MFRCSKIGSEQAICNLVYREYYQIGLSMLMKASIQTDAFGKGMVTNPWLVPNDLEYVRTYSGECAGRL